MSSENGKRYVCPADGCDYTGLQNSVAAHFSGTKNESHKGGYEKAKTLMEPADESEAGDTADESPELAPSEFPGGEDRSDSGGSAEGTGSDGDLDDGLSCPGCGETDELYEADAVLRDVPDEHISPNHRGLLKRSDAVCGNCGGVFDIE